jgi:TonB family protein
MSPAREVYVSRLNGDPRVGAVAVGLACLFNLALAYILIPAEMRRESDMKTAMRFAYAGKIRYDEIRVALDPSYLSDGSGRRTLLGAITAVNDAQFRGKVTPVIQKERNRPLGQQGTSPIAAPGLDPMERLRLLYGNLPTALSEDIATRFVVKPDYPDEARTKGIEGMVVVIAFVDEEGKVEDVALESAVDPLLDQAAIRAAYRTPFYPYRIEGVAQAVFVRMPYRFELVGTLTE